MKIPAYLGGFVRFAAVAVLLGGCRSSGASPGVATGLVPGGLNAAVPRVHVGPHRVWVAPDIARYRRLLFISDAYGERVDILSMPDLVLKGRVVGFTHQLFRGLCSDNGGNVWVVSTYGGISSLPYGVLTKLAHDGKVLKSMTFSYGVPVSCAIDPTTRDLAVTEVYPQGGVVIYEGGAGPGRVIRNPQQFDYEWDGYDTSGNLWVDGGGASANPLLSNCTASTCTTIPITGGKIYYPGFLQYVVGEKSWYIADGNCNNTYESLCIYPISNNGVLGTAITVTDPQRQACSLLAQGAITNGKSRVLAGVASCGRRGRQLSIALWKFPAGGVWTHDTTMEVGDGGVAISEK
ncbi:MAG: hypothetical protein JO324_05125 [Candidatus Eremiobacteraeota bacterium]|nr:hypothetical protein [Candidatus Eremiobacteraeota bacterium]